VKKVKKEKSAMGLRRREGFSLHAGLDIQTAQYPTDGVSVVGIVSSGARTVHRLTSVNIGAVPEPRERG
jgi:hypothetical protein